MRESDGLLKPPESDTANNDGHANAAWYIYRQGRSDTERTFCALLFGSDADDYRSSRLLHAVGSVGCTRGVSLECNTKTLERCRL